MTRKNSNIVEFKIFGSEMGVVFKRLFAILFIILALLLLIFIVVRAEFALGIIGIFMCILIGFYFVGIANRYSFYVHEDLLIVKNEYLYFNEERCRFSIGEVEKVNYRFDNAPQYGTTHITIYTNTKKRRFKINTNLTESEPLLRTFQSLGITLTFSNIQTAEQKQYANKWLSTNINII